ncbi:MAG: carbon monoxide dehydrogenase subunit G [Novosphingobium sp.]
MNLSGEQRILASRERVWTALNDPSVLRQCIPGCQSLEKDGDNRMRAVVEIKIGPIGARFGGLVTLSDIFPPESYTITGQGQGGTVGTAKGAAKVRITSDGGATILAYTVEAEVGGRLAQLGGPIIDATAKQLSAKFFKQFGQLVEDTAPALPEVTEVEVEAAPIAAPAPAARGAISGTSIWGWIAALVVALLAGYALGVGQAGQAWVLLVIVLTVVAAAAGYEAGKRDGRR